MNPNLLTKAQVSSYRNLKQSKFRKQTHQFLLEGVRLCEEALRSNLKITACITEKGFEALEIPSGVAHFLATRVQIEQISDSKTPQGVICVAQIPEPSEFPNPGAGEMILALDRLTDPGNMGTILRAALWFGVKHILLGPGCVDPFSPKVTRSSMGAITQLELHPSVDIIKDIQTWNDRGGETAALHMMGVDIKTFQPEKGLMLVLGSEAHGVDPAILNISRPVSIQRAGSGESLNAAMAASIALYELKGR
jgi:TrmH family RNA methyltransferase